MVSIIHNNLINTIQALCHEAHVYGSITYDTEEAFEYFSQKCGTDVIDDAVQGYIRKLWNEPCIRQAWDHRSRIYLRNPHNVQHFLDRLPDVTGPDYVPTDEDILRLAMRTTAFNTVDFNHNGLTYHLFDVGGLRSERPRWPQRSNNISTVIFTVNMSEYDQYLHEDPQKLRLVESATLFQTLLTTGYFRNISVLLVFTHLDVFEEKILSRDLSGTFPKYTGASGDKEGAKEYITKLFHGIIQANDDATAQANAAAAASGPGQQQQQPNNKPANLQVFHINSLDQDQLSTIVSSLTQKAPSAQ